MYLTLKVGYMYVCLVVIGWYSLGVGEIVVVGVSESCNITFTFLSGCFVETEDLCSVVLCSIVFRFFNISQHKMFLAKRLIGGILDVVR